VKGRLLRLGAEKGERSDEKKGLHVVVACFMLSRKFAVTATTTTRAVGTSEEHSGLDLDQALTSFHFSLAMTSRKRLHLLSLASSREHSRLVGHIRSLCAARSSADSGHEAPKGHNRGQPLLSSLPNDAGGNLPLDATEMQDEPAIKSTECLLRMSRFVHRCTLNKGVAASKYEAL